MPEVKLSGGSDHAMSDTVERSQESPPRRSGDRERKHLVLVVPDVEIMLSRLCVAPPEAEAAQTFGRDTACETGAQCDCPQNHFVAEAVVEDERRDAGRGQRDAEAPPVSRPLRDLVEADHEGDERRHGDHDERDQCTAQRHPVGDRQSDEDCEHHFRLEEAEQLPSEVRDRRVLRVSLPAGIEIPRGIVISVLRESAHQTEHSQEQGRNTCEHRDVRGRERD